MSDCRRQTLLKVRVCLNADNKIVPLHREPRDSGVFWMIIENSRANDFWLGFQVISKLISQICNRRFVVNQWRLCLGIFGIHEDKASSRILKFPRHTRQWCATRGAYNIRSRMTWDSSQIHFQSKINCLSIWESQIAYRHSSKPGL